MLGSDGFFKAERNMTKDESDEEGVEQDGEDSSVVVDDDAEGVSMVKVGTTTGWVGDGLMVSLSEVAVMSICNR